MGIDLEDIKLCVCRTVHLFIRVSCRFVQQQPYVFGALLFLFALYIFLPSVLSFLFYCLPFLGLTGILLAFWTSKRSTIRSEKVESKKLEVPKQPTPMINRNRSVYLRNATSRRQRFKDKSEVWRTDSPSTESVESVISNLFNEMKELQSSYPGNNASARSTSVDKEIEVSSKKEPLMDSALPVKPDLVACDASNSQANKFDSGGDETKNESSEDPEDEDEEEAQEDKNKAMEWTEDDQKNLMDLGLSEIERNRRLESLIARRRARKLNKRKPEEPAQIVGIFPPGQISKIITSTKNDSHNLADGCKEMDQAVPLPGSAPSVLLPMRNPFDLPYDPHEEKPNLMADSFQQEFTAAHQKEVGFCRHESFCFGPVYPEENGVIGYHHSRYRRPSISIADKGEHDWLIEQLLFKGDLHAEKNPIAVETRGIQTDDSRQVRDKSAMELESDQEKGNLPNSESEFEMEPELTQDSKSQSSHSSSSDNLKVICDDVRAVSKGFESTLSSALNKSLNCRLPKSRLIKEPPCDFSPTAFDKNKIEERFPYPDKVACHTPAYSIASDLQVEVSEIGSPPTVDGNNTDAESLNHDWEIEKGATFGGEQDDTSSLLESQSNEIVSNLQEEEVKAMSVAEALSPKTIRSPMAVELGDQPSQAVPEELSIPADDDEAINHIVVQKESEDLANVENTVKTRDNVDGGLEILMKQVDDVKKASSLEEADIKSSKYSNDGPEDSSGCRSRLDHAHSEAGSRNVDLITVNGDPSSAHDQSEEGSKNKDQITGNRDLGLAHEHSEVENKSTDQVTGNGDFVELKKIEEQLELIQDNKNQPNVVSTEFQSSKDALKSTVENDVVKERGVPLDTIVIIQSDVSLNQVNAVQSELQKSDDAMKLKVEQHSVTNGGVRLDTIDVIGSDASRNQVNDIQSELQRSDDATKSTVEQQSITDRGVRLDTVDIIDSNASQNKVNDVQSELQRSNGAMKSTVEQHSVTDGGVPLDTIDIVDSDISQNQVNDVQNELQRSDDATKSNVEQHSVTDRGVRLDTIDIIDSDASQNQVNDVQSELQRSNGAMKSTVEQHSVTDGGVPLDTIDVIDSDASQNQVNDVQSEFQRSNGAMKSTVEQHSATEGGVPLDFIDVIGSDVSRNQVNDVQTEFQRSNDAMNSTVEQHSVTNGGVPLHTIDIIGSDASQNQVNVVQTEFQKSNDAVKSTVEQDSVNDRGVPLDTIDIGFNASQNQVNVEHQNEFQKFNDAIKSTVEQRSATERELLDAKAELSSNSSIEEQIHTDKVSFLQDSIVSADHNAKTMENDYNKPDDSIEVERELIKDVSGQNGDKSNLDSKDDHEKTDQKLSLSNAALNNDLEISESTVQEEVAADPQTETTSTEVQIETEPTPTTITNKNMEAVGDNKIECETQRFNKQESDVVEQLDNVMESYSKDLNGMGLQKPTSLAHENPLGSSLSADKESQ